ILANTLSCIITLPSSPPLLFFSVIISLPPSAHPSFPTRRSSDLKAILSCFGSRRGYFCHGDFFKDVVRHLHQIKVYIFRHIAKRSEEHTSELQSRFDLVCRLLLEKKKLIVKLYLSRMRLQHISFQ